MQRFKLYVSKPHAYRRNSINYKMALDGDEHMVNAVIAGLERNGYHIDACTMFDEVSERYVEVEILSPAS